ncbi:MAG: sulfurase [Methylophaga sp.]|nr:sulfurase [Methylophaga sp.]
MTARVIEILFTENAGEPLLAHPSATLIAGKGIVGDRYYAAQGTFSDKFKGTPGLEVTLIEQEKIDEFNTITGLNFSTADFRRNIVTQDIDLNALVEQEFYVGKVKLRGIMLCEPCVHLEKLLDTKLIKGLTHKAGLRAQIITSGDIAISDTITTN